MGYRVRRNRSGDWGGHCRLNDKGERVTHCSNGTSQPFAIGSEVVCNTSDYTSIHYGQTCTVVDCYVSRLGDWIVRVKSRTSRAISTGMPYYARNFVAYKKEPQGEKDMSRYHVAIRQGKSTSENITDYDNLIGDDLMFANSEQELKQMVEEAISRNPSHSWVLFKSTFVARSRSNVRFDAS